MLTAKQGSDLKIHIRIAASSLGWNVETKGKSIAELKEILSDLRREQLRRNLIKKVNSNG